MKIIEHFIPVFTSDLESMIAAYARLLGAPPTRRWRFDTMELELCIIKPFVLVTGPSETLQEVSMLRAVIYVDDLSAVRAWISAEGIKILYDLETPVGPSLYVKQPDCGLIEYIQPDASWRL